MPEMKISYENAVRWERIEEENLAKFEAGLTDAERKRIEEKMVGKIAIKDWPLIDVILSSELGWGREYCGEKWLEEFKDELIDIGLDYAITWDKGHMAYLIYFGKGSGQEMDIVSFVKKYNAIPPIMDLLDNLRKFE